MQNRKRWIVFLDEIYHHTDVKISIKTRIGKTVPEEFEGLLQIYNQYPVEELIIHPRVQLDFYKNHPNLEVFAEAVKNTRISLCYNGDINTIEDARKIKHQFPEVTKMMLGRGIICNPQLTEQIEDEARAEKPADIDRYRIRQFLDQICRDYQRICSGDKNVLFKLKEIWCYLGNSFPGHEKQLKQIKKAEKLDRYEEAVNLILF